MSDRGRRKYAAQLLRQRSTTISDPPTNFTAVYSKTDGELYIKDGSTEYKIPRRDEGSPTIIATKEIDGATNSTDTDVSLYAATNVNIKKAKLYVYNANSSTANVRVAHVDGAAGALSNEDYILYDVAVTQYETVILNIEGIADGHTLVVRSDTTDVNFKLSGTVYVDAVEEQRLGSIDIDGTTNTVDTNKSLHTTSSSTKGIYIVAMNRGASTAEIQIALLDDTTIGNVTDADWVIRQTLTAKQHVVYSLDLDLNASSMIIVRSGTAGVNFLAYGRVL